MCLLAIFYRAVDDAHLIVGANREESYSRASAPPQILDGPARALAGMDLEAGGTWLGVNETGFFVAVTNRPKTRHVVNPRSRGLLAREMLSCRTIEQAIQIATQELDLHRYAGCNVICGDADRLIVFQAGDWLRIKPLPPGLHVITNEDVNDTNDPRLAFVVDWLGSYGCETARDCVSALRHVCAFPGNGSPPVCLRGKASGTVSSTVLSLTNSLNHSLYLHAHGPPNETPYQDCSSLLHEISSGI
ncbi:MAG: NRDE family protein [Gemmataceae bacterium]